MGKNKPTTAAPLAVITDKLDYAPGEIVTMTITGVTIGGTITYTLADSSTDPGDDGVVTQYVSTTVVDGGAGDYDPRDGIIVAKWTVPTDGSPDNATINLSVTDWGKDDMLGAPTTAPRRPRLRMRSRRTTSILRMLQPTGRMALCNRRTRRISKARSSLIIFMSRS